MEDPTTAARFPYIRLPEETEPPAKRQQQRRRRSLRMVMFLLTGLLAVGLMVALTTSTGKIKLFSIGGGGGGSVAPASTSTATPPEKIVRAKLRGLSEGVSLKSFQQPWLESELPNFPWTTNMLSWQRTSFHFQPQKNWMNGIYMICIVYTSTLIISIIISTS